MLNIFKSDRLGKAYKAIEANDLDKLLKQLQKIDTSEINQPVSDSIPPLAESCIIHQAPKALKLVISFGASINVQCHTKPELHLTQLVLEQTQSLPLLNSLLTANPLPDLQPLMMACFEHCSEQELMLHLSALLQHGTSLNDSLMHKALLTGQQPLVHFMIHSGAKKPDDLNEHGYDADLVAYANKCWEDIKIREMFLS